MIDKESDEVVHKGPNRGYKTDVPEVKKKKGSARWRLEKVMEI